MEKDTNICRLCLKIIEKNVTYSHLTNNNAILQNLNLISFVTIKNLQLTENPVICGLCDNKLKQLANFKENIITNEFQIQCNQKKDLNSFLETVSPDFDKICRLCLKASEDASNLQKNWKENKKVFIKCNIHLNLNIPKPSKVCNECDVMLQDMWTFVQECSENEKHIVLHSSKGGKLTSNNLLEISSNKAKNSERINDGEDNNNDLQKEEKEKAKSLNKDIQGGSKLRSSPNRTGNVAKITEKVKGVKWTSKEGLENDKNKDKIFEVITAKKINKAHNAELNETPEKLKNNSYIESAETEDFIFNRTPKTYARAKPKIPQNIQVNATTSKLNIFSAICLKKRAEPSTSKVLDNETIIDEMQKELLEFSRNVSIDVMPLRNLADITLEIDSNGIVESDTSVSEKDNVTQELINLLEGTEEFVKKAETENPTLQYKDTEELLKVLEDDTDGNLIVSVIIEQPNDNSKTKEGKSVENQSPEIKQNENTVVKKVFEISDNVQTCNQVLETKQRPRAKEILNKKSLKGKSIQISADKRNKPLKKGKNISQTNVKINVSPTVQTGQKKHNLRQKTIVMSFREMLNMKPLKKKDLEATQEASKDISQVTNSVGEVEVAELSSKGKKNIGEPQLKAKSSGKKKAGKRNTEYKEEYQDKEISQIDTENLSKTNCDESTVKNLQKLGRTAGTEVSHDAKKVSVSEESHNTVAGSPKQENSILGKKRGKKLNLESQERGVPKKQAKKWYKRIGSELAPSNLRDVGKSTETDASHAAMKADASAKSHYTVADSETQGNGVVEKKHDKGLSLKSQEKGVPKKRAKTLPKKNGSEHAPSNLQDVDKTMETDASHAATEIDVSKESQNTTAGSRKQENGIGGQKRGKGLNLESREKGVPKESPKKKIIEPTTNNLQETEITREREASAVTMDLDAAADSQVLEVHVVAKKRGKRINLESETKNIPKKRVKKSPKKEPTNNIEAPNLNIEQLNEKADVVPPPAKKRVVKARAKASQQIKSDTNELTEINEDEETESESHSTDHSELTDQPLNKPVVVTIIRRKKNRNKAQRDKTWQELTGKQIEQVILQEGEVPKAKRGRPPLPQNERKPKKPKPVYLVCNACPFKTISQNILIQHQFIHNVVDEVAHFKCNQCTFRTTSEELLEQHKATHLNLDLAYRCVFCEYSHKKKASTMYHTLRHDDKDIANMFYCIVVNQLTEEEYYECFQCEYQNTEELTMPDHVIDHQTEKIRNPITVKHSCQECPYKTKFEDLFKRHLEMHVVMKRDPKFIKKEAKIKKEPEEESHNHEDRPNHEEIEDESGKLYSCSLCPYLTRNKRSLANHKGRKHTRTVPSPEQRPLPQKQAPSSDKIYRCNECSYSTYKKPHLTRHVVVHKSKENMEFMECMHCLFETKHRRSYTRHMEIMHRVIV